MDGEDLSQNFIHRVTKTNRLEIPQKWKDFLVLGMKTKEVLVKVFRTGAQA